MKIKDVFVLSASTQARARPMSESVAEYQKDAINAYPLYFDVESIDG